MMDNQLSSFLEQSSEIFKEVSVDASIGRKLGMERTHQDSSFADENRLASVFRDRANLGAGARDDRRSNKDHGHRLAAELRARLEALVTVDLPAIAVALDVDVHEAERAL